MTQQHEPAAAWKPRRSFANTDPKAAELAELLHAVRNPRLTILFGSRAKGDYAWGRSDVDIMLVEDSPPEGEAAEASKLAFRRAKAQLYRGQNIEDNWILRTPEDFRERTRFLNSIEAAAIGDGYALGEEAEGHVALARMRKTNSHLRWAKGHIERIEGLDGSEGDDRQGTMAYFAVSQALMAAVTAAGEWCPKVYDVELLLELARQADPAGSYATGLDPEIYTQYGENREGIPPERPFTREPEHLARAVGDTRATLARVEELKASWPARRR